MMAVDETGRTGVDALRVYYGRVHGAMVQAGWKKGILRLRQFPLQDDSDEVEPGAEDALRVLMALGIRPPGRWER